MNISLFVVGGIIGILVGYRIGIWREIIRLARAERNRRKRRN